MYGASYELFVLDFIDNIPKQPMDWRF